MITFKDYLTEGVNDNFLYHGTSTVYGFHILNDNRIYANTLQSIDTFHTQSGEFNNKYVKNKITPEYKGVSLTRDYRFAKDTWRNEQDLPLDKWCVFVLDKRKLQTRYKILPISYIKSLREEAEEFVIGDIKNLNKYLLKVKVFGSNAEDVFVKKVFKDKIFSTSIVWKD